MAIKQLCFFLSLGTPASMVQVQIGMMARYCNMKPSLCGRLRDGMVHLNSVLAPSSLATTPRILTKLHFMVLSWFQKAGFFYHALVRKNGLVTGGYTLANGASAVRSRGNQQCSRW
ncbi:hypothetical protein B0J12DRAFT_656717 [Macrophomina phaseolina]|uniref:Secreted protein n=1 Tax=Macrophomina phaseolina TaxID=35725 RepID=A0ABQ8GHW2_9PEZI|nr:hypothetical protein B0J12DRAFT_656717 [Macrophomina phaseolina]